MVELNAIRFGEICCSVMVWNSSRAIGHCEAFSQALRVELQLTTLQGTCRSFIFRRISNAIDQSANFSHALIAQLLLLHLTEQVQSLFDPIRFFREARQHGSRYPRALSPQCPIDSCVGNAFLHHADHAANIS